MKDLKMDSQETARNAAESPANREPSAVKPSPPLSSAFRARPQGPPGVPRQPIDNGPVGQPRPRPIQQIRFENRPVGPVNPGQFARPPYGNPRPGSFPPRPQPDQNQNQPTVLNPRYPSPPGPRPGPQQGPRPPPPGNYPPQRPEGNVQRAAQHPRPEHQGSPQQGRNPEFQKQLRRDESLLNLRARQGPPFRGEDNKPAVPRIVIGRMADVDNSRKLEQFENAASREKTRENTENDDDDDVVMDGKSPRANGNATNQDELIETKLSKKEVVQPVKRPETATINGKIDGKTDAALEKVADIIDDKKSVKEFDAVESDNRLSSMNKQEADDARNQSEQEKKLLDDQIVNEKGGAKSPARQNEINSPSVTKPELPPMATKFSDNAPSQTPPKSPLTNKSRVGTPDAPDQKQQELKTPKSADKSRANTPIETNKNDLANELTMRTVSKSPEQLQENTSGKNTSGNELKTISPNKSRASTPGEMNLDQHETKPRQEKQELKTPVTQNKPDNLSKETKEGKNEQELKLLSTELEKSRTTPVEMNQNEVKSPKPEESIKPLPKDDQSDEKESKLKSPDILPSKDSSESKVDLPKKEESKTEESRPVDQMKVPETLQLPPKSPETVKGFDNGQQKSLSLKSSPSRSPRSPASPKSPKSPTANEKLEKNETKKTTIIEESSEQKKVDNKSESKTKSAATKGQRGTPMKPKERSDKKSAKISEIENGSVTNESQSNAGPTTNGDADSPMKKSPSKLTEADKRSTAGSPVKSPSKSVKSLPRTPDTPSSTGGLEKKKLPMNKIQVGAAPSPNLKTVRSKIGSLENASYKPGGGKVKIENRKLDFSKAQPKIAAKNEKYAPSGGDKKIAQVKLQWNAKPKVGSLDNATYKPGGGDKKIETVKLDFKDKAKSKVGSKDNAKHIPGGGAIKSSATPPKTPQDTNNGIQTQKIDIKAESKIGSLDNVKHKPGGGDKKIFNDTSYLRQTGSNVQSVSGSGSQIEGTEENSSVEPTKNPPQPPPSTPTKVKKLPSPSSVVTPKAVRSSLAKSPDATGSKKMFTLETGTENEDQKTLNSEDKIVPKGKPPKSPIGRSAQPSPNSLQLKSPETRTPRSPLTPRTPDSVEPKAAENKTRSPENRQLKSPENKTKSPITPRTPNNSELKVAEDKTAKSPTSPRSSNSPQSRSPEDRVMKSPVTPRSPNSLRLKTPEKSTPPGSGKASPKEWRLPKLAPSPTPPEPTTVFHDNAKINLPKLIER